MTNIYDWETNVIDIMDKYENHFYLELRGNKNTVKGSSGTGKSFLFNMIKAIKQRMDKTARYNADNIFLLSKDNIDKLESVKNKLIMIDKAELLLGVKEVEFINMDDDNRYLIFSRAPLGIEMSPNHQADLVTEDGITKLQYRFNVRGWC